jgi:hypothetical protein
MLVLPLFASGDTKGVLSWAQSSIAYRHDRAALEELVKVGYIELIDKNRRQNFYKVTQAGRDRDKGLDDHDLTTRHMRGEF